MPSACADLLRWVKHVQQGFVQYMMFVVVIGMCFFMFGLIISVYSSCAFISNISNTNIKANKRAALEYKTNFLKG